MTRVLSYLSVFAVAGGLAIAMIGAVEASSPAGAATLPNMSRVETDVTPAHCRRYYHCERVCKRRWYGKRKCREDCHRC
jgi:DNA topoisomerase IB